MRVLPGHALVPIAWCAAVKRTWISYSTCAFEPPYWSLQYTLHGPRGCYLLLTSPKLVCADMVTPISQNHSITVLNFAWSADFSALNRGPN